MSESELRDQTPIFDESIGGALIDAARINVMAAMQAFISPAGGPRIALPGEGETGAPPDLPECLVQALEWLDAARAWTMAGRPAPTSFHLVGL